MNRRDTILAVAVACLWGFNFVVISWGMADIPPLLFVTIRFVVVLLPAILLVPRPAAPLRVVLAVGTFMSLGQFGFLYAALAAGLPPGIAALVLQAQVLFTIGIAAAALGERPRSVQLAGTAIGSLGLLTVGLGRGGDIPLLAFGLCLLGALSWAIGNIVSRSSGVAGGLSLTVWSALAVPLPAFALALVFHGWTDIAEGLAAFDLRSAASTLYTGVLASLVGYGIFNSLLARNRAADVVPFVLLAPVVAILSAAVLLDQRPNPVELAGAATMVIGVLLCTRGAAPPPSDQPESTSSHQGPAVLQSGHAHR